MWDLSDPSCLLNRAQYDEPVVNWGALKATFSVFGDMFNKK
jgi:hypothetical protein